VFNINEYKEQLKEMLAEFTKERRETLWEWSNPLGDTNLWAHAEWRSAHHGIVFIEFPGEGKDRAYVLVDDGKVEEFVAIEALKSLA